MRGFANDYALANAAKKGLNKRMSLAKSSFLATLANKPTSSMSKENASLRQGKDLTVYVNTKAGKPRRSTLFTLRDWKAPQTKENVDERPTKAYLRFSRSTLEPKLPCGFRRN
jgi:hypothetical protein